MTVEELLNICGVISPFELQEKWDNSGLNIGLRSAVISGVYAALEADQYTVDQAAENSALIVHHPLIFSPLKSLDFSTYPSNVIRTIIQKNIHLIAMHTNFDKTHLNRYVAQHILGWQNAEFHDLFCTQKVDMSFDQLLSEVKQKFNNIHSVVPTEKHITTAALCTGSGADILQFDGIDCLITGDVKYHSAVYAHALKIGVIDIGHYESERFFAEIIAAELLQKGIKATIALSQNPFHDGKL